MRLDRASRTLIGVVLSAFVWVSCAPMLSKRTDEQAWIDYLQEIKSKRGPASNRQPEKQTEKFSEISVRKILLSCNRNHQMESCYRSKALVAFDSTFKNEPNYKKLQAEFFSVYSYDKVFSEVQSFHQVLLSGMELRAVDHVRELHQKCDDREDESVGIHNFGPILGGDTDIPRGYYNCLNEEIEKDEEQLLTETTERLGLTIVTPEARQWIRERQIHPVYEKYTHDWFQKQLSLERSKWDRDKAEIAARFERGESLNAAVKRLSLELRHDYKFLPLEVALTELYKGAKHP